jgi:spermidine synthase
MKKFEKLLSYLYPLIIESSESEVNPFLEVVYRDGKYQLNSLSTNYSYGGLYELFKLFFKDVYINWAKVENVLILGFGAGCIVPLIQRYKLDCNIVGVELDAKVIELGNKHFGIDKLKNTFVINDSALNFIANTNQRFDLVIIDVYVDNMVPKEVETISFLQNLKKALNCDGIVIFNKLIHSKEIKSQIPVLKPLYQGVFGKVDLFTIMRTGVIFVAQNKNT